MIHHSLKVSHVYTTATQVNLKNIVQKINLLLCTTFCVDSPQISLCGTLPNDSVHSGVVRPEALLSKPSALPPDHVCTWADFRCQAGLWEHHPFSQQH